MNDRVIRWAKTIARWLERALAGMDWRHRVLILVIGVELIRTLVTHDLGAVLELVAFVIAGKLLKTDLTALDILLSVSAFVGLLAARRFLLRPPSFRAAGEGGSQQERAGQQAGG